MSCVACAAINKFIHVKQSKMVEILDYLQVYDTSDRSTSTLQANVPQRSVMHCNRCNADDCLVNQSVAVIPTATAAARVSSHDDMVESCSNVRFAKQSHLLAKFKNYAIKMEFGFQKVEKFRKQNDIILIKDEIMKT